MNESDALKVDFTKLFIGPYTMAAPPYESIYQIGDGQMMGDSTMEVVEIYRQAGFDISDSYFDAPDHISAELEFMCVLFAKCSVSNQAGDLDANKLYQPLLKNLLVDHLGCWVPLFAQKVKANANTVFYGILAEITDKVIQHDLKHHLIWYQFARVSGSIPVTASIELILIIAVSKKHKFLVQPSARSWSLLQKPGQSSKPEAVGKSAKQKSAE